MSTQEFLQKHIEANKGYEDLPARLKVAVSETEWRQKAKWYCVHRGFAWNATVARSTCSELEYYESLLMHYRASKRLFPYHLSEYICRIMRATPFRYYRDMLSDVMKDDLPYDALPNFTAADIVRLTGIGRNEYIAIMLQAKSKKLLWKVNRGIVRELLPATVLPIKYEPWWLVHVVNLGDDEYRGLRAPEAAVCNAAAQQGGLPCGEVDAGIVIDLYRRGLIWLEVPIHPDDYLSIPPLEGFVSNKTSISGDTDPLESLLYQIFVAASDRLTVAKLAGMLSVDVGTMQMALSMACRLRFCRKLQQQAGRVSDAGSGFDGTNPFEIPLSGSEPGLASHEIEAWKAGGETGAAAGSSVALIVDSEVTGFLMMGALTPGCKKHSVTLFEGGRVYGPGVIEELLAELRASADAAKDFEGEMQVLASYTRGLACALDCLLACAAGRSVELLRKEAISSLSLDAAMRILAHSYCAVLPIARLPNPPLPIPIEQDPVNFGPFGAAATPWFQLALFAASQSAPPGLVLPAGQKLRRLPSQLSGCDHALVWAWGWKGSTSELRVEYHNLLFTLNELLPTTALLVQPISKRKEEGSISTSITTVALPLPIVATQGSSGTVNAQAFPERSIGVAHVQDDDDDGEGDEQGNGSIQVQYPPSWVNAMQQLGLSQAIGYLRLIRCPTSGNWLPLQVCLGLPIHHPALCQAVCDAARQRDFLSSTLCRQHQEGQSQLQVKLKQLCTRFAGESRGEGLGVTPTRNLQVTGDGQLRDIGASLDPVMHGVL